MSCPVCGSKDKKFCNRLGNLLHSRCAACGIDYNTELKEERSTDEVIELLAEFLADEGYHHSYEVPGLVSDLINDFGPSIQMLTHDDYDYLVNFIERELFENPDDDPYEIIHDVLLEATY